MGPHIFISTAYRYMKKVNAVSLTFEAVLILIQYFVSVVRMSFAIKREWLIFHLENQKGAKAISARI